MPTGSSGSGGREENNGPAIMMENISHPMQDPLSALCSSFSDRSLHPRCVKERYRRSFLPAAVRLHNQHYTQYTTPTI
ncbi:hypothetical protein VZT92_004928 [Zoarces viviparus]|uniref:Uncharacterized protein n=1 Tax=Zoarces viviparus TaxID=48416 RepID=A0AAW1FRW2_ZOAVI